MQIHVDTGDSIVIIHLNGDLTHLSQSEMENQILPHFEAGASILLDLSDTSFSGVDGLRWLADLNHHALDNDVRIGLVGLPADFQGLLADLRALSTLPRFDNLQAGLEAFAPVSSDDLSFDSNLDFSLPLDEEVSEEVNFSAFYPKELAVEKWYSLLVYAYIPAALEAVRQDAQQFKDEIGDVRESKPAVATQIKRGTEITVVPSCEGVIFNPERVTFKWYEDHHRLQFRLRADADMADMAGNGQVTLYVGPVIVGTLKMGMLFSETGADPGSVRSEEASGSMYRQDQIFISYSHRDTEVVTNCQKAYEALGFEVLIDSKTLRSGQNWNDELMRMIERADIFQLFWSENSSKSQYCQEEWEHALNLNKGEGFIRPVFWKEPIPNPPAELGHLHFDYIPFTSG